MSNVQCPTCEKQTPIPSLRAAGRSAAISCVLSVFFLLFPLLSSAGAGTNWNALPDYLNGGIVIYGDTRSGHSTHRDLVQGITHVNPAAVFHTGDLVANGNREDEWKVFSDITSGLRSTTVFYPALGNHEKESPLFFDRFGLPDNKGWYSVDVDGIHFIVLDTNVDLSPGSDQHRWLIGDLEGTSGSGGTIIAVFHHPPYNIGSHRRSGEKLRRILVPLFRTYGVGAVFSGHDHNYQRFEVGGIPYVVTGGGGAPLYSRHAESPLNRVFVKAYHFCVIYRRDGQLRVAVIDDKAGIIDRFVIF